MKILITGYKGMLGSQIVTDLERGYTELGPVPERFKGRQLLLRDVDELDITDMTACITYMNENAPDVVINCAAYTNVDGCETNEEDAFKVNALGARNLAIACRESGAKLVHVSTDYVFSGREDSLKREYDLTGPVSVYGKTKLAGEEYVRQYCQKSFVVRTAWLYGYTGKNFAKTMLSLYERGINPTVVNDQHGSPTNAADLSHHLLKIADSEEYGLYHCTNNGQCTWFEFAYKIAELSGLEARPTPCTSEEYPTPTKRPPYSYLDNMMLRLTVGDEMRTWQRAIESWFKLKDKQ